MAPLPLAALGGALGAILRHLIDLAWPYERRGGLPWDLFVANIAGCAATGYLAGRVRDLRLRAFLLQGVIGGLTSFAGVVWTIWESAERSVWIGAGAVVVLGLVAGILAAAVALRRFGAYPGGSGNASGPV